MANYAVIDNGLVVNIIVADSEETAELVSGFGCAEVTEENPLGIGWYWDNTANGYIAPKPYESWTYNYEDSEWQAPTPMPIEDGKIFDWNEDNLSWVEVQLPTE